MIRSLRRRHLRMIVVLAVLVTVLFVLAIRSRPAPPPTVDPPETLAAPGAQGTTDGP